MKFCTMCGEGCTDDTALENHRHLHRNERLPVLSVAVCFAKAFNRAPTDAELDRLLAGEADEVFEEASATLG